MRRDRTTTYLINIFGLMATTGALLLPCAGCSPAPDFFAEAKARQKKVLTSTVPLYCFAHAVAGDDAFVLLLTNTGPHEHEAAQVDIFKVNKAEVYIYNGLTLDDSFSEKMLRGHTNKNLKTLNVGSVMLEKDKALPKDNKDKLIIQGKPLEHKHAD